MNTKVISINKIETPLNSEKNQFDELEVVIFLDEITIKFRFTVKTSQINDRTLLTFIEDVDFSHTFRFNDHIAVEITNLVKKVYQGENINFPINVGDFGTSLEVVAQQKSFERELVER